MTANGILKRKVRTIHVSGATRWPGWQRQRRKPESCTVRTLLFPLAAIPENDRQRNSKEEGANCTGLRRHPLAGVASAPWGPPPTVGHVARLPAAGAPAYGEFREKCVVNILFAKVLYFYIYALSCVTKATNAA